MHLNVFLYEKVNLFSRLFSGLSSPLVSVVLLARTAADCEACLDMLSRQETTFATEVVVVDRTPAGELGRCAGVMLWHIHTRFDTFVIRGATLLSDDSVPGYAAVMWLCAATVNAGPMRTNCSVRVHSFGNILPARSVSTMYMAIWRCPATTSVSTTKAMSTFCICYDTIRHFSVSKAHRVNMRFSCMNVMAISSLPIIR